MTSADTTFCTPSFKFAFAHKRNPKKKFKVKCQKFENHEKEKK